jgi:hypothetical protein
MRLIALCRLFHQKEFPRDIDIFCSHFCFYDLAICLVCQLLTSSPNRLGYLAMGMAFDLDLLMK